MGPQPGGGAGAGPQGEGGYGWAGCWAGQGGGGPLDQVLGPIPWLLETSGPEGGRGIGLRSGTEVLSPLEQAEEVGVAQTEEAWLLPPFSVSGLWRALTIPTGIVPATLSVSSAGGMAVMAVIIPAVVVMLSPGTGPPLTDLSKQEVGILVF